MESLFNSVNDFCQQHGFSNTYWIAYSGGLDSHVLLHLLAKLRSVYPLKLQALYVNHGVSPSASAWATHCEAVCAGLDIDFRACVIDSSENKDGASPEDWLRVRRYDIFSALLEKDDFLLTAHHQNDQAETVLLQLLRGSGPKGLSAMPVSKKFAKGFHVRPLLNFTREELKQYAEKNQLQWIEDESNQNVSFARNFIRRDVLPLLMQRWPTVTTQLARTAANCAENQALLEFFVSQDLEKVSGSFQGTLSVEKLSALSLLQQRQVVRRWITLQNFSLPSSVKLQHILHDMLLAGSDKMPHVQWGDVSVKRYRDNLFLMQQQASHDKNQMIAWNFEEPLVIKNIGTLHAELVSGQGLRVGVSDVTVRFRQGGEVLRLPKRTCHHELKNLFQESGVPPWQRDRIPLIYVGDVLAAVAGFYVADEFVVNQENQQGWIFTF